VPALSEQPTRRLLDENLAARIVGAVSDLHPGSVHVSDIGLFRASDLTIWDRARQEGFVIVSKDEDFQRLSIFEGPPPKVIWIRLGNCSTEDIIRLLRERHDVIGDFLAHPEACFLALA
jgi:predicted nuclease of predicted toxin-antitoxin system